MRNDLYIKLGMPASWKKEVPVNFNNETLIPDAMYMENGKYMFVEIDNVQTMRTNYDNIKKYKELSKIIFKQYSHHPTLIWYSLSNVRKEKLKKACEKQDRKSTRLNSSHVAISY